MQDHAKSCYIFDGKGQDFISMHTEVSRSTFAEMIAAQVCKVCTCASKKFSSVKYHKIVVQ